jgi:hypothetical protein
MGFAGKHAPSEGARSKDARMGTPKREELLSTHRPPFLSSAIPRPPYSLAGLWSTYLGRGGVFGVARWAGGEEEQEETDRKDGVLMCST